MDIYGLYSYGQTWTSSTIQNNRTSMVYGYSHGSPEIVKQQAEKKKKQKKKKESNIFFDFLDDIGDAIVETGKKAVDTVVDVGKYVGEKVVEYAPTVGTFIVENAPVLSNIKSGADFLFGVDVLTGERLSSTDRTLAFFGTFTGGGVKNLAESGFKNGSKFLNNLTPTVTRNVNKGKGKDELVNIASEQRTKHILYGDKTGGGHLWPGTGDPKKTLFPKSWNAEKVMHNVSDIATDPKLNWNKGRIVKGVQRYEVTGIRDGINIKVITDGKDIITAFPIK